MGGKRDSSPGIEGGSSPTCLETRSCQHFHSTSRRQLFSSSRPILLASASHLSELAEDTVTHCELVKLDEVQLWHDESVQNWAVPPVAVSQFTRYEPDGMVLPAGGAARRSCGGAAQRRCRLHHRGHTHRGRTSWKFATASRSSSLLCYRRSGLHCATLRRRQGEGHDHGRAVGGIRPGPNSL
jgi:hypothetical protein